MNILYLKFNVSVQYATDEESNLVCTAQQYEFLCFAKLRQEFFLNS